MWTPFQIDLMSAALIIVVSIFASLLIGLHIHVRRALYDKPLRPPESLDEISEAELEPGERIATAIGERIEAIVQEALGEAGDFDVDFSREPDGTLAVWVDGKKRADSAAIADLEVRQAVPKAVDRFNEGTEIEE